MHTKCHGKEERSDDEESELPSNENPSSMENEFKRSSVIPSHIVSGTFNNRRLINEGLAMAIIPHSSNDLNSLSTLSSEETVSPLSPFNTIPPSKFQMIVLKIYEEDTKSDWIWEYFAVERRKFIKMPTPKWAAADPKRAKLINIFYNIDIYTDAEYETIQSEWDDVILQYHQDTNIPLPTRILHRKWIKNCFYGRKNEIKARIVLEMFGLAEQMARPVAEGDPETLLPGSQRYNYEQVIGGEEKLNDNDILDSNENENDDDTTVSTGTTPPKRKRKQKQRSYGKYYQKYQPKHGGKSKRGGKFKHGGKHGKYNQRGGKHNVNWDKNYNHKRYSSTSNETTTTSNSTSEKTVFSFQSGGTTTTTSSSSSTSSSTTTTTARSSVSSSRTGSSSSCSNNSKSSSGSKISTFSSISFIVEDSP